MEHTASQWFHDWLKETIPALDIVVPTGHCVSSGRGRRDGHCSLCYGSIDARGLQSTGVDRCVLLTQVKNELGNAGDPQYQAIRYYQVWAKRKKL